MQKFKFSYDKENDDLFLHSPKSKSKGSIELGRDLIIDFNSRKEVVGLQILNASNLLKDLLADEEIRNIRQVIANLEEAKVDIKNKNNLLIIAIYLMSKKGNLSAAIPMAAINIKSPALAHA